MTDYVVFAVFSSIFMTGYAFGMLTMILNYKIKNFELTAHNMKQIISKEKWPKPPTTNMIYKKYKKIFPGITKHLIRQALK